MPKQLELFAEPAAKKPVGQSLPHNGTDTSRDAAESIAPVVNELARGVYDFIKSRGPFGATDEEQQMNLGIPGNTQRPRRNRLEAAGLIRRSGDKRATASGRMAHVWVASDLISASSAKDSF